MHSLDGIKHSATWPAWNGRPYDRQEAEIFDSATKFMKITTKGANQPGGRAAMRLGLGCHISDYDWAKAITNDNNDKTTRTALLSAAWATKADKEHCGCPYSTVHCRTVSRTCTEKCRRCQCQIAGEHTKVNPKTRSPQSHPH